ncbi:MULTISPECIES: class 1 fructose-bisphosphatase [unclassified Haladaptatus]|uniref:class 1 fructose-bisphosphatase n=1 Tax=unclassified Haladaptatus TaxID=2622732 RepID=UPI00209BF183|nr:MULTISPECIES: class 1 fructose-bisphosphatase [unclassified Haladaptatus]MCO8244020.1 fructose-1,6-bisphosphatase [Haladaptatus sp. AB643]MCO8255825.1 fructose-1,6-bisphosphatase [Haladaptatus sp. AB618]
METVTKIIEVVAAAAPEIRGGLTGRRRKADEENPSGEIQMAADVWADEYLEAELTAIDGVGEFASEERERVVDCGDGLSVAIDPLDGSSNLKSNNSMGTIVGIYDAPLPAKGTDLVASAFVLFGPITTMMVARDDSVTEYVVEDGEQRVVTEDVTLPDDPTVYGFGGRVPDWPEAFTAYAREVEDELKLRYGGAMIGDVNQVLTYGGVFAYPGLESRPEGKLRLQFEGNPMAYIIESAGGRSSNGEKSILEVTPERLHQRVPLHIGNADLIERLEAAL